MVDPQTERTARAICRVEAQRYADRLEQEAWINLNWPSFAPHARAALEAMQPPRPDEIPEPKVGQVWRVTNNNRIVPRTILSGTNGSVVYSKAKTTNFWTLLEFQAWARRTGARPVEDNNG